MKHPDQSPESRQRQQHIEELRADIKRTRTTVKSLRTRWRNMSERIESLARNAFGQGTEVTLRAARLGQRLLELLSQIDSEWLHPEERFMLEAMQPEFSVFAADLERLEEHETDFEQYRQARATDESRASAEDRFAEFRTAPEKEEQRDIRKLYLELSKRFHPDKARNAFEQRRFTEIQQQVTQAFETGDTQALFELRERLLDDAEDTDAAVAAGNHDAEVARIAQLERQLSLLRAQQERLSEDIAALRNSPYGQLLTETDRAERYTGIDLEESLAQQREMNEMMEKLVTALEDSLRLQARSPLFDAMPMPGPDEPDDVDPGLLLDFLNEMFGAEDPEADFFADEYDDEEEVEFAFDSPAFEPTDYTLDLELLPPGWEPYTSPKFKPGTVVRLKLPTTLDLPRPERFTGRVLAVIRNRARGETGYLVQIDEGYFKGMDEETLDYVLAEYLNYNPNTGASLMKGDLIPLSRGKAAPPAGNTRRVFYEWGFQFLRKDLPEQFERLVNILSRLGPKASDLDHWDSYLREQLAFPLEAKLRPEYVFGEWANQKVRIQKWVAPHPFLGIMVMAEPGLVLPLHYFTAVRKRDPAYEVLEDYLLWADIYLELYN